MVGRAASNVENHYPRGSSKFIHAIKTKQKLFELNLPT